jgi:colanic acid/amylovoran biosynthesis glycosyltransferase
VKIIVVVSEFPKITETFAYRNVIEYMRLGHDVRIFHLKRYRRGDVVHGFMERAAERAFTYGYASPAALGAFALEAMAAPRRLGRLLLELLRAYRREPKRGMAAFACLPKALALGRHCRREGVDHIHAEFAGHPATAAMIASGVGGAPFSFSAHAHDIFISQALLVAKADRAAFVRGISRFNLAFLEALEGFPADKLHLVRCGVPREALAADGPSPPCGGPLRIVYVGALLKRKGVRHLIDALAALPPELDWQARIVGGGALAGELEAQAIRLGLKDRVRFEGPQPAETVARIMARAHAMVVPSVPGDEGRTEGIPVVLMEAMALGVPVIASALSGIPELVEDGATGQLVAPGDAAGIARALEAIHADWSAAAAMAARGRRRIADDYVVEDNARMLADLMESAA